MELLEMTNLLDVLQTLADDIRDNYKEHLEHSGRYTSEWSLINSVRTEVKVGEKEFEVTMTLHDYWKYVEEGTNPHFPPVSAILRWVQIKPIVPRPFDNGKIPTEKQLAFLIARKISEVGTEGSHDLQTTKENVINWYREKITDALAKDVGNYLTKVLITEY